MNDIEQRLSAIFRERALDMESAPVTPPTAGQLRRQVRHRQAATASVAALIVLAIVGGAIGVTQVVRDRIARPARPTATATATLTTGGVTITYPGAWTALARTGSGATYVGDAPPGAVAVLPILQVSSFPLDYQRAPICPLPPGRTAIFPNDGVLLYIERILRATSPGSQPVAYPVPAKDVQVSPPGPDPCRGGDRVTFQVRSGRLEAFLVAGERASRTDRDRLVTAFEHMAVDPVYVSNTLVVPSGPKVDVLTGAFQGAQWRVEGEATESGPCVGLVYAGGTWLPPGGLGGTLAPILGDCPSAVDLVPPIHAWRQTYRRPDRSTVTFLWGEAVPDTASVLVEAPPGAKATPAALGVVPGEVLQGETQFSVWVWAVAGPVTHARAVAYDDSGRILGQAVIDCSVGNVCE